VAIHKIFSGLFDSPACEKFENESAIKKRDAIRFL